MSHVVVAPSEAARKRPKGRAAHGPGPHLVPVAPVWMSAPS